MGRVFDENKFYRFIISPRTMIAFVTASLNLLENVVALVISRFVAVQTCLDPGNPHLVTPQTRHLPNSSKVVG